MADSNDGEVKQILDGCYRYCVEYVGFHEVPPKFTFLSRLYNKRAKRLDVDLLAEIKKDPRFVYSMHKNGGFYIAPVLP